MIGFHSYDIIDAFFFQGLGYTTLVEVLE